MGKSFYEMYQTDPKKETEGIVLDYEGMKIRIARAGGANIRFKKILTQRLNPFNKKMAAGLMEDEVANKIMIEVYADTIVLDWEGVTDEDGNAMQPSRENIIKLFMDLPELFKDVDKQASDFTLFQPDKAAEQREEAK